jgi:ankyrin repeat protein
LVSKGASLNEKCLNYRFTALYYAINDNRNVIINALINSGANIMAKDKDGNNPLHFASMQGNESVVLKLIAMGAKIDADVNQGVTPIFFGELLWPK